MQGVFMEGRFTVLSAGKFDRTAKAFDPERENM